MLAAAHQSFSDPSIREHLDAALRRILAGLPEALEALSRAWQQGDQEAGILVVRILGWHSRRKAGRG
jgi:hypothetical protein